MACIFVGLALITGVAAYFGFRKARGFMEQFAQPQPLALPSIRYSPQDLAALQQRIDAFLAEARAGQTNARLALSANDLNALIASTAFSNRVYVSLEGDVVTGQISLPFEELGMPLFRGRYLNGLSRLEVGCGGGVFSVTMKNVAVNGISVPDHYQGWIQKQNFVSNMATNVLTQDALNRVGRIGVVNQQLILEVEAEPAVR